MVTTITLSRLLILGRRRKAFPSAPSDPDDSILEQVDNSTSGAKKLISYDANDMETKLSVYPDKIDILDIFEHGRSGHMRIGADVLIKSDDDPESQLTCRVSLKVLDDRLSDNAHVRLLGCDTAHVTNGHSAGRHMLVKFARALGKKRIVFGTLAAVESDDFAPDGFIEQRGIGLFFSSLSALDSLPPSYNQRQFNLGKYWATYKK